MLCGISGQYYISSPPLNLKSKYSCWSLWDHSDGVVEVLQDLPLFQEWQCHPRCSNPVICSKPIHSQSPCSQSAEGIFRAGKARHGLPKLRNIFWVQPEYNFDCVWRGMGKGAALEDVPWVCTPSNYATDCLLLTAVFFVIIIRVSMKAVNIAFCIWDRMVCCTSKGGKLGI